MKTFANLVFVFAVAAVSILSQAQAADASARHYTAKPYIFEGERQTFFLDINNSSSNSFRVVRATISFTENIEIRGLDGDCSLSRPANATQILCILPLLKANSFERISYDVVGDLDFRAGFEVSASISSLDGVITIQDQDAAAEGVSDNDLLIEGSSLGLVVTRDILRDSDSDGVSDMSENAMGTDPNNPFSFSNENAIIDVAVLQSEATESYYSGKFGGRIESLLAATNQHYKDNNIAITLRLAALGTIPYDSGEKDVSTVADEFFNRSGEAFSNLDSIIENTGADMVVFFDPIFRNSETEDANFLCGVGQSNTDAIQGDFYKELFGSRMLSVASSSLDCFGRRQLTGLLALNMGIAVSRQESPEGGTFPFSVGYVEEGYFSSFVPSRIVREATSEVPEQGSNLLSNPERLCFGRPCGIDRSNLATGADATFSLNATRHMIAELSPPTVPVVLAEQEHKTTINSNNLDHIEVRQYPNIRSALLGDWVTVNVEASNTSTESLNHLQVSFGGDFRPSSIRTTDSQCAVLALQGTTVQQDLLGASEGVGAMVCFVNKLEPGETAGFTYSIKIGESIDHLGEKVFSLLARVNNHTIRGSQACLMVSEDATQQAAAINVCPLFTLEQDLFLDPRRQFDGIDPNLLPEVAGSIFTVPFIQLFDGDLVSAQFKVSGGTSRRYELIDLNYLSSAVSPVTPSNFSEDGILTINKAIIEGLGGYSLTLRLERTATTPTFVETALSRQ